MLVQFPVKPYQCSSIGIGLLVQQKLGDSVVATVSCHVQRCEVVQCDIINRRLVLQQEFHTLYVVSLGRHVQWGQSVLCEDKSEDAWMDAKSQKKQYIEERDGREGMRSKRRRKVQYIVCFLSEMLLKACFLIVAQLCPGAKLRAQHIYLVVGKILGYADRVMAQPYTTLVLAKMGAPLSSRISTAGSCPLLAAQCRGVSPSCQTITQAHTLSVDINPVCLF